METVICSQCGKECLPTIFYDAEKTKPMDTGYGVDKDGNKVCFECCGANDEKTLEETGKLFGYLICDSSGLMTDSAGRASMKRQRAIWTGISGTFTNWPGTLRIKTGAIKRSVNNFGAERLDFWFTWKGNKYHGVNVGDNQCATVKRVES